MIVMEAINRIDAVKPNAYKQQEKIRWLSILDGMIKKEIIDTHETETEVKFAGYSDASLMETLLVPPPYDDIYIKWLEAQIDYANGEYNKYNNTSAAYNNAYVAFARAYHRDHMPKGGKEYKHF